MVCFGLIVLGAVIEPTFGIPATNAPGSEIVAYFAKHEGDGRAALFAYGLAFGVFPFFAAGVWSRLRRFDEPLAASFGIGAAVLTTLILAGFVPEAVAGYRQPD